jgi:periplasmic protein TonB
MRNLLKALLLSLTASTAAFALSIADITDVTPKVDQPPVPLKTPPPVYPEELKAAKTSGVVSIIVVIDEKGDVMAAEVGKATHDGFREPALESVKKWKFKPAEVGGKTVKVKVTIPLRFNAES